MVDFNAITANATMSNFKQLAVDLDKADRVQDGKLGNAAKKELMNAFETHAFKAAIKTLSNSTEFKLLEGDQTATDLATKTWKALVNSASEQKPIAAQIKEGLLAGTDKALNFLVSSASASTLTPEQCAAEIKAHNVDNVGVACNVSDQRAKELVEEQIKREDSAKPKYERHEKPQYAPAEPKVDPRPVPEPKTAKDWDAARKIGDGAFGKKCANALSPTGMKGHVSFSPAAGGKVEVSCEF